MNSHLLVVVGASCLSLGIGYFAGSAQPDNLAADSESASAASSPNKSQISSRGNHSSRSSFGGSRVRSARGNAELTLHAAKSKLEESNMLMMDFGTFAEVWNTLDGLTSEEIEIALKSIEDDPATNQTTMMLRMMLLSQWGGVDGQSAAEYAISIKKGGMMQGMGLMGCMSSWIKNDPVAAEAWYEQNKAAFKGGMFGQNNIKGMFFKGLAKKDLTSAFNKIDFTNTSERKAAIQTMGSLVADVKLRDKVIEKVQSMDDPELKDKMLKSMVSTLSYQDLDAATALVDQLKETNPEQVSEYQESLLHGMRMADPEATLDYIQTEISDGKKRDRELKNTFGSFASNDEAAAQKWLDSQDLTNKDEFIERASSNMTWQNPDKAMEWALKINDDDKRTEQAIEVYERWEDDHSAGAKAWLDQQDPETQEAILAGDEEDS